MIIKLKQKIWLQVFIIYTRYLIGSAFVFASIVKISGERFTAESGALNPINSSWHLFETLYQSGLYWKFLGIAQLVSGFLLMTQRFAKLGAIINLPIIANVFVITLSYYFAFTPIITGLMFLANLMLIAWDWNTLKVLLNLTPNLELNTRFEKDVVWETTGVLIFLFIIAMNFFVNISNVIFCFLLALSIGLIGLIIGLKRKSIYG